MEEYIRKDELMKYVLSKDVHTIEAKEIKEFQCSEVVPVVHSKWVKGEVSYGFSPLINAVVTCPKYTCLNCGYETGAQAKEFVCCPMCGAKMDLAGDDA